MEINGLGNDNSSTTTVNRFNDMSSEDFMRIMFTELSNQDPLDPQDSSKLLEQISSIRDIESNMDLMNRLDELVQQNQFASAGSLVGYSVRGLDESNYKVEGRVTSVSIENDRVYLTIESGERIPFDQIEEIYENQKLE